MELKFEKRKFTEEELKLMHGDDLMNLPCPLCHQPVVVLAWQWAAGKAECPSCHRVIPVVQAGAKE